MVVDVLINIVSGIVNLLLAPLDVVNFVVDIVFSVSVVGDFIRVVAYLFPWEQITPLIFIVIGFFVFRGVIALIKTIWDVLPLV